MGRTIVKICGLRRLQDAEAANRARPDLAGMILSPGFGRSIDPETACAIRGALAPKIRTVGVFVDAGAEYIRSIAQSGCIDMIQMHGREEDGLIREVGAETGLPVIKVFRVRAWEDLEAAASSAADWILLDSGEGGTGQTFDWTLLETFLREQKAAEDQGRMQGKDSLLFPGGHPWILAGGLSPENVSDAIRRFRPSGVDVSSRVETDGWKDPEKMLAFVQAAGLPCRPARGTRDFRADPKAMEGRIIR